MIPSPNNVSYPFGASRKEEAELISMEHIYHIRYESKTKGESLRQIARDTGFDNTDPAVQEEWKKMTLKGERPTPEEVINYAVKKLKGK